MKKVLVELMFTVTDTCNNGKERTFKKSVFAAPIYEYNGRKLNNSLTHCVPLAIKALEDQHYYNIEFIGSRASSFTFTDDFTTTVW